MTCMVQINQARIHVARFYSVFGQHHTGMRFQMYILEVQWYIVIWPLNHIFYFSELPCYTTDHYKKTLL